MPIFIIYGENGVLLSIGIKYKLTILEFLKMHCKNILIIA